ncbi:glycosyltransferase family 90 protein [Zasmidium cellare ATCC 36951]|uniref:Glycosyltransferase family 90 protein n=1 Tax=Zasmidium cellare ATCC 36951 TaxID=1080233 RepID=A0A6A6D225_ZASCE|nr:glycosyltransferase family 90 protein [Zasmidium cellare ATCC 36951]KAF2171676.1 glycosyltransferase family 90 protein [Zasmidium cellare ATCC 36951]
MPSHNVMDRAKWPAFIGLVLGTVVVTNTVKTTFAFDKTVHSSIATLACSGGAIIGLSRWLPRDGNRTHKGGQYEAVPLAEVGQPHASRDPSPSPEDVAYPSSLRKLRIVFLLLVALLGIRVEVMREVVRNVQCSRASWEPIVPLVFAAWDYWAVQRKRRRATNDDDLDASVYDALERSMARSPYSCVATVALVILGSTLAMNALASPASTFICAAGLPFRWLVPQLQRVGTVLDVAIIFCIYNLLKAQDARGSLNVALRFASVGYAFLSAAALLLFAGIVYYIVQDNDRIWILTIPHQYFWSVLRLDLVVAFTVLCAMVMILQVGVMTTTVLTTFTSIMTAVAISAWANGHPFPPHSTGIAFLGVSLAILGFMAYFHLETMHEGSSGNYTTSLFRKIPSAFYLTMLILFFFWTGLWATSKSKVNYHPIDMLIFEAQRYHHMYLDQTAVSTGLAETVTHYQERYGQQPPPGFDHWYRYATERNSTVIDSFDSIHHDLDPFYALEPQQIRHRTWEMIANQWNDVAGISIRNGQVTVAPNIVPTHRWMADGLAELIGKFAKWLPDMDLAFNLNDECRVSVPYEDVVPMRQIAQNKRLNQQQRRDDARTSFSDGRAEQWKAIAEDEVPDSPLEEISWQYSFHRFGSVGCPPNSPARRLRHWDVGSFCTECAYPQSLGAFLSNWTVAGDICHQPDLADLHGLYLSPASFKGTHELYPLFSQSKANGFNDILYPSAWNYLEKAKYDPNDDNPDRPFSEKNDTIFWRGATSEGVSQGRGQWRGMARQRFIHLANNINNSAPPQPLLLPTERGGKLSYWTLPSSELTDLLKADIHVVDSIARCAGPDCEHQAEEFAPLVPPSDFQHHWTYKFLLDLDGAGFSGRFLPFLQSRSLPFKAALFREWWDDRVTAWAHFIPLDLRGHGFWATLAYFQGLDGKIAGGSVEVKMDPHVQAAERIAEAGREWAEQVLRKEDMEIYFFRLLLEWGRLTDDRRDELGVRI